MTQLEQWLQNTKPIIAVITIDNIDDAVPLAKALVSAGVNLLEITLRTSVALDAIDQIHQQVPNAIVGAGTVCTADQFQQAVTAGVKFIVSPGLTEELIIANENLKRLGRWPGVFIPGVATASEIMRASNAGYKLLKCFPAQAIGAVELIKAWAGPFPDIQFCPTGGVKPDNFQKYLDLPNVICTGVSWLCEPSLLENAKWQEVEKRANSLC